MMQRLAPQIHEEARVHLGILNSVRAFDYAQPPQRLLTYANTGGFGIDGTVSSLLGAAIASPDKEFFCVIGDLAFFYDINALSNPNNCRNLHILIVNNDGGQQFRNTDHPASRLGKDVDSFVAAMGHYGPKSPELIKHYVENIGIRYLTASSKDEFESVLPDFLKKGESVVLEAFTTEQDENEAFIILRNLIPAKKGFKPYLKKTILHCLNEKQIQTVQRLLGKFRGTK